MIVERKPCDDVFEREEKSFRKAAERLLGAATTCVRQAGMDLARACRLFRHPDIQSLGTILVENLRGEGNFDNVRTACSLYAGPRRKNLQNLTDPSPEQLIVVAALNLQDAVEHLLAEGVTDLLSVGPATIRSRSATTSIMKMK